MSEASPYAALGRVFEQVRDMDAPLSARLAMMAEAVRADSPQFAAAVDQLVSRIAQAGVGLNAPAVGEPMSPFMLPDQTGRLTSLQEILQGGPAVVSFLRGHWCPYCRLTATAFARVQGVIGPDRMVAITPETRSYNARLMEQATIAYRVLTDPDCGYALSLGLTFWVDDAFAELMRGVGQDLSRYQAAGAWLLPIPATFVLDREGRVTARHVDPDYRRRMEVDDLLAAFARAG
jgi:peroxiredoxin